MNRILIVRLSALGDIVHALPVLAALRRAWPAARVDWIVDGAYAPILSLAEGLHRRVIVRAKASGELANGVAFGGARGYLQAVRYLRSRRYDEAFWKELLGGGAKRSKEQNLKELGF